MIKPSTETQEKAITWILGLQKELKKFQKPISKEKETKTAENLRNGQYFRPKGFTGLWKIQSLEWIDGKIHLNSYHYKNHSRRIFTLSPEEKVYVAPKF